MPHVNEEWLREQKEDHELLAHTAAFGLPETADLTTTEFGPTEGVQTLPKWEIPEKLIITAAPVGGFISKRQNSNHPIQPDEIRGQARNAIEAGAPSVHFHARDPDTGYNILDSEIYHRIIDPLKEDHPDIVYDATTIPFSPDSWDEIDQILKDDLIEISEINPTASYVGDSVMYEPPDELIERARMLVRHGVKPLFGICDSSDIGNAERYLIKTDVVEEPYLWALVAGLPGTTRMTDPISMIEGIKHQVKCIRDIPGRHQILLCAGGRGSRYLATLGIILGCHVRVGMEDTIFKYPHRDDRLEDTGEEVQKVRKIANMLGREVATPGEYREMIGLE